MFLIRVLKLDAKRSSRGRHHRDGLGPSFHTWNTPGTIDSVRPHLKPLVGQGWVGFAFRINLTDSNIDKERKTIKEKARTRSTVKQRTRNSMISALLPGSRVPLRMPIGKIDVVDKWTVRLHLNNPSAVLVPNLTYYPIQFMALGSVDKADTHPVGCGPFKFKSWKKFDSTVMERFENWYETDDQGNALPYLDGLVGRPKKEDRVRLTALRTGEVDLIDNMSYADGATFEKEYGDKFNTWPVPQVGTGYIGFNWKNGPFSPKNPHGKLLRQAAAHAVNHQAVHQAVFNGVSSPAPAFYSDVSPWYMPEIKRRYEFDPDKARFLIKKAGAQGEPIILLSRDAYAYMHQTGEIVHAMLSEVGLNVKHEIHPYSVLKSKWRKGEFHLDSSANSYRPDPDAWYGRSVYSEAGSTKLRTGFKNERADKLILEAQNTLDKGKRHELYMEVENIVNEELPMLYTHYIPLIQAGVKKLKGYQPAFPGPYSTQRAGLRTAYMS